MCFNGIIQIIESLTREPKKLYKKESYQKENKEYKFLFYYAIYNLVF